MRHSHTSIELFHNCPRRYCLERILKKQAPPGLPLVVGSLYHKVLEILLTDPAPARDLPAALQQAIRDAAEDLLRLDVDIDELEEEITENVSKIDFEHLSPVRVGPQLLVERWFSNAGLNYVGKIDLVNRFKPITDDVGNILGWTEQECILDLKVLQSKRRKSQRNANFSPQLASYCLETGCRTAGFYEIPRNLEKPHRARVVEFTEADLEMWKTWRQAQCTALTLLHEQAEFHSDPRFLFPMTPRENPLCTNMWCPHWDECYG